MSRDNKEGYAFIKVSDLDLWRKKEAFFVKKSTLIEWCEKKKAEIAREIFEEIEKIIVHRILHNENYSFEGVMDSITKDLDELKKKYEILNSWEELTHTCQVEIPHSIESIADIAFQESEGEG